MLNEAMERVSSRAREVNAIMTEHDGDPVRIAIALLETRDELTRERDNIYFVRGLAMMLLVTLIAVLITCSMKGC